MDRGVAALYIPLDPTLVYKDRDWLLDTAIAPPASVDKDWSLDKVAGPPASVDTTVELPASVDKDWLEVHIVTEVTIADQVDFPFYLSIKKAINDFNQWLIAFHKFSLLFLAFDINTF